MIDRVGIEFEGAWNGEPYIAPFTDVQLKHDGSVHGLSLTHMGELVSPPLSVDQAIEWAVSHTPDQVNRTCGTHIHMSFKRRKEYAVIVSQRYHKGLYAMLDSLVPILHDRHPDFSTQLKRRLDGENSFCRRAFRPTYQMIDEYRSHYRYAGINYCWKLHNTVEIRVLPGIDDRHLCRAVLEAVFDYTNNFIRNNSFKDKIKFRR